MLARWFPECSTWGPVDGLMSMFFLAETLGLEDLSSLSAGIQAFCLLLHRY